MDDYSLADFQNATHKQIIGTVAELLADGRLDWSRIQPFLDSARALCRADFDQGGARLSVHGEAREGEGWAEAEEAYLALTVAGAEDGREWLSRTWWLSDLVLADPDPERIAAALAGLERSAARIREALAAKEGPGEAG